MSDQGKNRRQFVRIFRNFMVSYTLKGKEGMRHEMSQVNNISRGGINFSATSLFQRGSELVMELKTPFLNDKVQLEGVVLEAKEKIPNMIYTIRVEFRNVSPQAADVLAKIEQYSEQQR